MQRNKLHKPPKNVANKAKLGLELRRKWKRGGTSIGLGRARQLARRQLLSLSTIKRMKNFFSRHQKNKNTPPEKGNGMIAWLLWGGDPGKKWADSIVKKYNRD